ncbi:MAG: sigma-E factor negative regulatory protein [Limnobacter sp.]|nr:sigma-E factor negative regulatory protein [Limnobacter sp.]
MNKFENLSALVDGELGAQSAEGLLKNLNREESEKINEYFLIGDLLRSSELHAHHNTALIDRISQSLDEEPTVISSELKNELSARRTVAVLPAARWFASVAAVAVFAFGINQAVPPVDSEVQMLSVQQSKPVTEQEIALWQEYFLAHQQNVIRSGLSGVSPMARVEADEPTVGVVRRVNLPESRAGDWMNIWNHPSEYQDGQVEYRYVTATR